MTEWKDIGLWFDAAKREYGAELSDHFEISTGTFAVKGELLKASLNEFLEQLVGHDRARYELIPIAACNDILREQLKDHLRSFLKSQSLPVNSN